MTTNKATPNYNESPEAKRKEYISYFKELIDRGYYLRSMYVPNPKFTDKVPRKKKLDDGTTLYENGFKDATNNFETFSDQMDDFKFTNGKLSFDVGLACRKSHLIAFDFDNGGNDFHSKSLDENAGATIYRLLSSANKLHDDFTNAIQETTPHGFRVIFSDANFTEEELDKIGTDLSINQGLEIITGNIMIYPSYIYDENGEKQEYKHNISVNDKNLAVSDAPIMSEALKNFIMTWADKKKNHTPKEYSNITENIGFKVASSDPLYLHVLQKQLPLVDEIIEDAKTAGERNNHFRDYARELYKLNLPDDEVKSRYWEQWNNFPDKSGADWNERAYTATLKSAKKYVENSNVRTLKDWVAMIEAKNEDEASPSPVSKARMEIKTWLTTNEEKTVPTNVLADIVIKYFNFIHLPKGQGGKLYLYSYDERNKELYGLYTDSFKEMEKLIYSIHPSYSIRYIDETIKKIDLSSTVPVKPLSTDWRKIPVKNCIYDLDTHKAIKFSPDYVFTNKAMTNFDAKYLDPQNEPYKLLKDGSKQTVDKFFRTIAVKKNGDFDPEIYKLLYQVCASAINPRICRKQMIVPYSRKAGSGKSTFEDVLKMLVGAENVSGLTMKKFEGQFALSGLINKMLNIGDDNSFLPLTDTSNLQATTTGNIVSVEPKGKTAYATVLHFLNVQSTNKIFRYNNKAGMDSRTLYIPFNAKLTDKNRNPLNPFDEDWIRNGESSAPSEWLLANVLRYYSDFVSYSECKASSDVKVEAVKDNDPVKTFAEEEFLPLKLEAIPCVAVYAWYKGWCDDVGIKPEALRRFTGDLNFSLQELTDEESVTTYKTGTKYRSSETVKKTLDKIRSITNHEAVLQSAKKTGSAKCFYQA